MRAVRRWPTPSTRRGQTGRRAGRVRARVPASLTSDARRPTGCRGLHRGVLHLPAGSLPISIDLIAQDLRRNGPVEWCAGGRAWTSHPASPSRLRPHATLATPPCNTLIRARTAVPQGLAPNRRIQTLHSPMQHSTAREPRLPCAPKNLSARILPMAEALAALQARARARSPATRHGLCFTPPT